MDSTSRAHGRGPAAGSPPRCDPAPVPRVTYSSALIVDRIRVTCYADRWKKRWRVDRRDVLRMGAVMGFGGVAGTGCATLGDGTLGAAAPPILPDLGAFLKRLDHGMTAI